MAAAFEDVFAAALAGCNRPADGLFSAGGYREQGLAFTRRGDVDAAIRDFDDAIKGGFDKAGADYAGLI